MNYRHAFHAGNFADVFKHVLLTRMLVYLTGKPGPLCYVDTHAGTGCYDLTRPEAERTGEWRAGIGRLRPPEDLQRGALLAPYLEVVGARDPQGRPARYPGSPAVAQALLRPVDRLVLAEKHPEDAASLRRSIGRDSRVTILEQDGYRVLKATVPPRERRGLVLIDPPFEAADEIDTLGNALRLAVRRWATGVYAVWYPITTNQALAAVHDRLAMPAVRSCRFEMVREPQADAPGLRGCGLFVVNPPYRLAEEAGVLLPFLCEALNDPSRPPFHASVATHDGALLKA